MIFLFQMMSDLAQKTRGEEQSTDKGRITTRCAPETSSNVGSREHRLNVIRTLCGPQPHAHLEI
jgi:hypothetical protein